MQEIYWDWAPFNKLSGLDTYKILALRQNVFIVEQNCLYQDADSLDFLAFHLCAWDGPDKKQLLAYLRVLPEGTRFSELSIGRLLTSKSARRTGLGRELIKRAFQLIESEFGSVPIRISAQAYLEKFYTEMGFETVSSIYLEDNIPHLEMLKK